MGYCQEIFVWQAEHLPLKKTKLAIGKSSYHFNFLAQVKHFDRPETTDWPVFKRKMTTLRKLPTTAPKIKIKMETKRLSIDFIISQKNPPTAVGGFLCKTFTFKRKLRFYIVDKCRCAIKATPDTLA